MQQAIQIYRPGVEEPDIFYPEHRPYVEENSFDMVWCWIEEVRQVEYLIVLKLCKDSGTVVHEIKEVAASQQDVVEAVRTARKIGEAGEGS